MTGEQVPMFARPEPKWDRREHGYVCEGCEWTVDRDKLELDAEGLYWLCPDCR